MPARSATLLDSNAGAPLHLAVKQALSAFLGSELSTGNPASLHAYGRAAADRIARAELAVLKTVRASPAEWKATFTASGSEANQLAIRSVLLATEGEAASRVWAVSAVEHACVLELVPEMKRAGVEVRSLAPSASGVVERFDAAFGARLISVIGLGNETGILQLPVTSHILRPVRSTPTERPLLHVDYVAGWGKADLDLSAADAPDLVAIAGHKLGAPAGIGALIHRRSIPVDRSGTPNLLGIVALEALAESWTDVVAEIARLASLRDEFEADLRKRFPSIVIAGEDVRRAPNVSHFHFPGLRKNLSLVTALDLCGFAVSAGSACASGAPEPSHVLLAMGLSELDAHNAVRVSLHPGNTRSELLAFAGALAEILKRHEIFPA